MKILIEACCGSVEEAVAAEAAGADRIELCAALPTGGVTPSMGMIEETLERVKIPVVVMVRPKEGRPNPSEDDFRAALRDVRLAVRAGAHQIITGFLDETRWPDAERNRALVDAADGRPVAFHRVFDMTPSLNEALEDVIEQGFIRVLTSGGEATVDSGMDRIMELVEYAGNRITILPGGGVRSHNVNHLVEYALCRELHFSFRQATGVEGYSGNEDTEPEPERIREIRAIVDAIN